MLHEIWNSLSAASLLDRVNLVLGILGVVLMIRIRLLAFPVGLAAVSLQGAVFWQARFYADAALQAFFFVLLAYGWWRWRHPGVGRPELPVTTLRLNQRAFTVLAGVILSVLIGAGLDRFTDAPMPFRDAFIAAFSVLAQALQAQKKLENWPLWTLVNGVAVWSYAAAGIPYTATLYGVYLVLGLIGWWTWHRAHRSAPEPAVV